MDHMDYSLLGERIRLRRKTLKMSQAALAEKCGISMSYVGHIERGTRSPSIELLIGLCSALSINPDQLLQDYLENVPSFSFTEADARFLEHMAEIIREPAAHWKESEKK